MCVLGRVCVCACVWRARVCVRVAALQGAHHSPHARARVHGGGCAAQDARASSQLVELAKSMGHPTTVGAPMHACPQLAQIHTVVSRKAWA